MEDKTIEFLVGCLIVLMVILAVPIFIEGIKAWWRYMKDLIN